ncbi:MAG: S8 family serine peptidase [Planctomycetota bacterium]|jgi:hypothetical protein
MSDPRRHRVRAAARLLALAAASSSAAGDVTLSYFDEPRTLVLDPGRVALHDGDAWSLAPVPAPRRTPAGVAAHVAALVRAGGADYVTPVFVDDLGGPLLPTRDLFVGFAAGTDPAAAEAVLWRSGVGVVTARGASGLRDVYRVRCAARDGFAVIEAANRLAARPDVRFAEPDMIFSARPALLPDDPLFDLAWGLHNTGQPAGCDAVAGSPDVDLDAPGAWDITTGDPAIRVVVIDGGYQLDHPDLSHGGFAADFTGEGGGGGPVHGCDNHGTAVAGCIAGRIDNALEGGGIAPGCTLASARVLVPDVLEPPCGTTFTTQASWTADALAWARDVVGARVTNNSNEYGFPSALVTVAYTETLGDGLVHFAAAGDGGGAIAYPASLPAVHAVTALDRFGVVPFFAAFGSGLAYAAPGVDVVTADRTGPAGLVPGDSACGDGTSLASAYAAGVAALTLSADPDLTAGEVGQILDATAVDLGAPGPDPVYGAGLLRAAAAVSEAAGPDCNANGIPDDEDLAAGTSADCNGNAVPDECDIASGTSVDCDADGVPDECEIDCNTNGVADACDIAAGTSVDFDGNGVPDECDPDCNGNGQPDFVDIAFGMSADCNGNAVPDECDLLLVFSAGSGPLVPIHSGSPQAFTIPAPPPAAGEVVLSFAARADLASGSEFLDVDLNGTDLGRVFEVGTVDCPETPDTDEITVSAATFNDAVAGGDAVITLTASTPVDPLCPAGSFVTVVVAYDAVAASAEDCDGNAVLDECDLASGAAEDCNGNAIPDACDIATGASVDFNANGIPDECEPDCNGNLIPDFLDLLFGASQDCDGSGIPDECENDCNGNGREDACDLADGTSADCDGNGLPDECDVASGVAEDCNGNVVPDACEVAGPFSAASGPLGPIGGDTSQALAIAAPPAPMSDVTIAVEAVADLVGSIRFLDVLLNGQLIGRLFLDDGTACPAVPDAGVVSLPLVFWEALVGAGDAVITIDASLPVFTGACGGDSFVAVTVDYAAAGSADADANGVVDACEAACPADCADPGDGVVDVTDLLAVLAQWGQAGAPCDTNGDGFVDVTDLLAVLAAWGACP